MNIDSGKDRDDHACAGPDKGAVPLDTGARLPLAPVSSPAAEVVKQIIEQILANERRRARFEFIRLSAFALAFLFAVLAIGLWFGRQMLAQLREERRLTEQAWQLMVERLPGMQSAQFPADASHARPPGAASQIVPFRPAGDRFDSRFNDGQAAEQDELAALSGSAAPSDRQGDKPESLPRDPRDAPGRENGRRPARSDFVVAPIAEGFDLRMPVP